jgi:hypothetical protein
MEPCDCCGKWVYERSMVNVGKKWMVCQVCDGMYSKKELTEKIQQEKTGGKDE